MIVLKIIGIIVLIILILLLTVLALILFVPIRYRARGQKQEMTDGEFEVRWMFGIIRIKGTYQQEVFRICAYIFGKLVYSSEADDEQ